MQPSRANQPQRVYIMEATAYCTGTITRSGTKARYGVVAADPKVIPPGSRIFIEGMGIFSVEDTGPAIKGNKLDVFLPGYQQCMSFGRRKVKVILIEEGGSKKSK